MNRQDFTSEKIIIRQDSDIRDRLERVEALLYAIFKNQYGLNPDIMSIPVAFSDRFIKDYEKNNPLKAKEIGKEQ